MTPRDGFDTATAAGEGGAPARGRAGSIVVYQRPDEATRTPGKSCRWIAEATVDGLTFTAQSRSGAANELARMLVAAGVADAPMEIHTVGLRGCMTWRSFYAAARRICRETAAAPLHSRRWEDHAAQVAHWHRTKAPKQGVFVDPGSLVAPDPSRAQNGITAQPCGGDDAGAPAFDPDADAIGSYHDAVRAIGERVHAGETLPDPLRW